MHCFIASMDHTDLLSMCHRIVACQERQHCGSTEIASTVSNGSCLSAQRMARIISRTADPAYLPRGWLKGSPHVHDGERACAGGRASVGRHGAELAWRSMLWIRRGGKEGGDAWRSMLARRLKKGALTVEGGDAWRSMLARRLKKGALTVEGGDAWRSMLWKRASWPRIDMFQRAMAKRMPIPMWITHLVRDEREFEFKFIRVCRSRWRRGCRSRCASPICNTRARTHTHNTHTHHAHARTRARARARTHTHTHTWRHAPLACGRAPSRALAAILDILAILDISGGYPGYPWQLSSYPNSQSRLSATLKHCHCATETLKV